MNTDTEISKIIPTPWEGIALVFVQLVMLLIMLLTFGFVSASLELGQTTSIYFLFLGELLLIIPLLLWVRIRGFSWRSTFYLHPVSWKLVGLSLLLGILAWPTVSTVVLPFEWILSKIGPSPELPTPQNALEMLVLAITVAVAAPLVEEPIFRGFVFRSWIRFGAPGAILVTGTLFGLMHGQLAQLTGLILVGILLGFVSFRSGSIIPAIILHSIFNVIGFVFLVYEADLLWLSEWYYLGISLLTLPFFLIGLIYFYRLTSPGQQLLAAWPNARESILIVISSVLVLGMFTIFGLIDIISRLIPSELTGL
jgi:membrane protease YdiL (CAAX protease family)